MLCGDLTGKEIQKKRLYMYIHTRGFLLAQMVKNLPVYIYIYTHTHDSLCYAAEINTTL